MTLEEILMSDDVVTAITDNKEYLESIIPELKDYDFLHQHPFHIPGPIWNHVLLALSLSENDFDIRLTLLLHDIGKKECFHIDEKGRIRYTNHPLKSAEMAKIILERLGYEKQYIEYIYKLIKNHDTFMTETDIWKNEEYKMCEVLYKIQYCDGLAHSSMVLEKRKTLLQETRELLDQKKKVL